MSQKVTVTEHLQSTSNMMHLEDVLEYIDSLHSVASEGELAQMDEAELMNVLRDIIYTAQETIIELEGARASKRQRQQPVLRIVPKVEKAG